MMKRIQLFYFAACPYCHETMRWIEQVKRERPELQPVDIEMIDERLHPDIADHYDYYYVPTFFVDGVKEHEGACSKEIATRVLMMGLDEALSAG